jgi:hypothetical protein
LVFKILLIQVVLKVSTKSLNENEIKETFRKHATFPHIIALTTILDKSCRRVGAMAPNAPNIIPIEPTFENPHRAYVAITVDLSCRMLRVS